MIDWLGGGYYSVMDSYFVFVMELFGGSITMERHAHRL
jgi:hypothetical protein